MSAWPPFSSIAGLSFLPAAVEHFFRRNKTTSRWEVVGRTRLWTRALVKKYEDAGAAAHDGFSVARPGADVGKPRSGAAPRRASGRRSHSSAPRPRPRPAMGMAAWRATMRRRCEAIRSMPAAMRPGSRTARAISCPRAASAARSTCSSPSAAEWSRQPRAGRLAVSTIWSTLIQDVVVVALRRMRILSLNEAVAIVIYLASERRCAPAGYSAQGFDLVSKRRLMTRERFRKFARLRHHQAPEAEDDRETQDDDRKHGGNARQSEGLQAAHEGGKPEAQDTAT